MPLYRFVTDATGSGQVTNTEYDLPSLRDAQFQAVRYLGELLSDDGLEFWVTESASMSVTDAAGTKLFTLKLGLA